MTLPTKGYCDNFSENDRSCPIISPKVEMKAGYFLFSDHKMRKVYGKGGLDLQVNLSYPLYQVNNRLNLATYASIEYLKNNGSSLADKQKTTLYILPVNLGIQPTFFISSKICYYFAIGPRFFYVHQHNHSHYVNRNKSRNGVGLFVNTGYNFNVWQHLYLDLFCEYSYAKTHFSPREEGSIHKINPNWRLYIRWRARI